MGKGIKNLILWFVLTLVAISFAIASSNTEGLYRYIYFIVSMSSCYLIRLFASKEKVSDGR